MATLTLDLPTEAEQFIKIQAAHQAKSLEEFVLHSVGYTPVSPLSEEYEYTTNDFNEETWEAIHEMEENRHKKKRYTADEMMINILGKGWQNA